MEGLSLTEGSRDLSNRITHHYHLSIALPSRCRYSKLINNNNNRFAIIPRKSSQLRKDMEHKPIQLAPHLSLVYNLNNNKSTHIYV